MKQEELKQIADLMRDAVDVLKKDTKQGFKEAKEERKEIKTDIEGMKILMIENFIETDRQIQDIAKVMREFMRFHETVDSRIVELERKSSEFVELEKRLTVVERELQIAHE